MSESRETLEKFRDLIDYDTYEEAVSALEYRRLRATVEARDCAAVHNCEYQVQIEELKKEIEELKKKNEWFRCAHLLAAQEEVWLRPKNESPFFMAMTGEVDGECVLWVGCNDTFAYACADAEEASYADAPELLRIAEKEGWPGLMRWVQNQREKTGQNYCDLIEPIEPIARRSNSLDAQRLRAEAAESALKDLAWRLNGAVGKEDNLNHIKWLVDSCNRTLREVGIKKEGE